MDSATRGFENFAEILEKKIRKQIEAEIMASMKPAQEPGTKADDSQSSGSDLMSQLLITIHPVRFTASSTLGKYPHKRTPPPPRPAHQLNGEQAVCYQFIVKQGAKLAENFCRKDLEKAFRSLALKLHPDQGGTTELFRALVNARRVLSGLL